jgi:hypothetical protein
MIGFFLLFATAARPALKPTQLPTQCVLGALTPGVKRSRREADHPPAASIVPRLWIRRAILPLPQYVFTAWCLNNGYVFMEWYLDKHRESFTFTMVPLKLAMWRDSTAYYGVLKTCELIMKLSCTGWNSTCAAQLLGAEVSLFGGNVEAVHHYGILKQLRALLAGDWWEGFVVSTTKGQLPHRANKRDISTTLFPRPADFAGAAAPKIPRLFPARFPSMDPSQTTCIQ